MCIAPVRSAMPLICKKMSGSAPFFNARHNQPRYAWNWRGPRKNQQSRSSAEPVDCSGWQSHGCVWTRNMQVQTKFLWLRKPVAIADQVDGWRVCWIGGWDRCRVLFIVMVADSDDSAWPSSNERFSDAQNCS